MLTKMAKWWISSNAIRIIFIVLLMIPIYFYWILNSSSWNEIIEYNSNEEWWLACYYRHGCYDSHRYFQYLFSSPIIIIHQLLWSHRHPTENKHHQQQQRLPKLTKDKTTTSSHQQKHKQLQQDQLLPLQVIILSGQSNMVGMGSMDHLDLITQSNYNNTIYRDTLWNNTPTTTMNSNGTYKIRYDIITKFGVSSPAGYLTCDRKSGFAAYNCFGPELMFGYTVGDYYLKQQKQDKQKQDQQQEHQQEQQPNILLLKIAWGGRNLAIDYRSPSSGEGNYTGVKPIHYGWEYRQLIDDTIASLNNISSYIPNYNVTVGYQIRGFVWFQGWNDMLDYNMVHEYESNLVNFIRDVRLDLDTPDLPFVIGELGMSGLNVTGRGSDRVLALREAQQNVCLLSEFHNTTSFVRTAPFAVVDGIQYNGVYHYYGRADTYFHIGQELGYGMIRILEKMKENENKMIEHNNMTQVT